jgi:CBS domain-containing protein
VLVTAPLAQPARMGLVVSAAPAPADEGNDWVRGLSYQPETCGGYTTVGACTNTDRGRVQREDPTPVDYVPWVVEVSDACTTMGGPADEARLRRRLEQRTSYAIARELWTGEQAADDGSPNLSLAGAPTSDAPVTVLNDGTALSPKRAVGVMLQALGDCLHGQRGMIHVPSLAAPFIPAERSGQLLTDKATDHLIVVDAGYPVGAGTQPDVVTDPALGDPDADAGQVWIYGTPMVVVRQGPVTIEGVTDATAVTTTTNLRERRAWRPVAATFDPCCRLAVLVDLTA